ncbi:MAG TPA: thiolase family protein [Candidatus Saccharimonadales bacterium]|nr:thiolase family protein [Candidatus Saccharimonadales bacterium]
MKRIYIAAYHQSKFGKLLGMTVPEIAKNAIESVCKEINTDPSLLDVGAVGAACNMSLNEQGLVSGLAASVPGLASKPIETVENACASGGQAILSTILKLQAGWGETGFALGYEKMRDAEGKMDGKLVGRALGAYSHPDERPGKTYIFPHLFAEIMECYIKVHGVTEADLAKVAVEEYANANKNPLAQMNKVKVTLDDVVNITDRNRYIVDGLPLKTYDCSQITDGYAALILATEEGLAKLGVSKADAVEIAGYAQATDPLMKEGRDVLRPAGAKRAMARAYEMAGVTPADVTVAEVHDCFSVMGALGSEVIGKAKYGEGAKFWGEGKARVDGECGINLSGGLIAKGHPIGATGVAMVGWCFEQLRGRAPEGLQVKNPKAAATFNVGGAICASVCTVLKG